MLFKILQFEKYCRLDYSLHFTWMFLIQTILLRTFGKYSIVFTFIFAIGKEIFDVKIKHGRFSVGDVMATLAGGLLAYLIQNISYAKIKFNN